MDERKETDTAGRRDYSDIIGDGLLTASVLRQSFAHTGCKIPEKMIE